MDNDLLAFLEEPNWKSAAAEESVDYQAVESSFMTQAYGFVANKAKVLFRDPFRLGFEIVHRNEKATKMLAIFAFRCNNALLYAPAFFVNGEIKGADMLYRSDVKRFSPLTDEWCAYLVRGANEVSGASYPKNGLRRQAEAHMDRLAYPQRVKYAAEDADLVLKEILAHCAQDSNPGLLVPRALRDGGASALEKLASIIESSEIAERFISENYSESDILFPAEELRKFASESPVVDPCENSLVLVQELHFAKSAAEREAVASDGYALKDFRPLDSVKHAVDYIDDPTLYKITAPGRAYLLNQEGENIDAMIYVRDDEFMMSSAYGVKGSTNCHPVPCDWDPGKSLAIIALKDKHYLPVNGEANLIGNTRDNQEEPDYISPGSAQTGKMYVLVHKKSLRCSEPFMVVNKTNGVFETCSNYGSKRSDMTYKGDAENADPNRGFLNDEYGLLEIEADIVRVSKEDINYASRSHDIQSAEPVWKQKVMTEAQLDTWMRTAGGVTHSTDLTITKEPDGLFGLAVDGMDRFQKVARNLSQREAHIRLATTESLQADIALQMLKIAEEEGTAKFRIFDNIEKVAYVTRMMPEQEWQTGYDPILNVRLDTPQVQHLETYTPERHTQDARIGDRYMGEAPTPRYDPEEDGLPADAVMSQSPEQLAQLASKYNLPHVFDHGIIGSLANNTYDTIEQVRQYIPDLETGVDRYARILFLLRYRPADFEEAYGKDALMEMESELTSLFDMSGKQLLRMLKRFDTDKFSTQSDS